MYLSDSELLCIMSLIKKEKTNHKSLNTQWTESLIKIEKKIKEEFSRESILIPVTSDTRLNPKDVILYNEEKEVLQPGQTVWYYSYHKSDSLYPAHLKTILNSYINHLNNPENIKKLHKEEKDEIISFIKEEFLEC